MNGLVALWLASSTARAGYGADAALGFDGGALLGEWPDPGIHTSVHARYDALVGERDTVGPRAGASLWASMSAGIQQTATEGGDSFPFHLRQMGVLAITRWSAEAPWSGLFGFGFGRIDLDDYYDGPYALPTMTFETGVRHRLGESQGFVDGLARVHWATARGPSSALDEWWMVELGVEVGANLR